MNGLSKNDDKLVLWKFQGQGLPVGHSTTHLGQFIVGFTCITHPSCLNLILDFDIVIVGKIGSTIAAKALEENTYIHHHRQGVNTGGIM